MDAEHLCTECGTRHDAAEPHAMTTVYHRRFMRRRGRPPTWNDAIAHCTGLVREAAVTGLLERMEVTWV